MIFLPPHAPGLKIGLYGGTFDPPHAGHLHVSKQALRRLGLDRIWWLVTPGNPLKAGHKFAPLKDRLAKSRALIDSPRIVATDLERELGTAYTIDTVRTLKRLAPDLRFVWIMGADSLRDFDRWRDWAALAHEVPLAVFDRPGFTHTALRGRAARALAHYRIDESDAALLPDLAAPAWTFLHGPRSALSSTAIRAKTPRI